MNSNIFTSPTLSICNLLPGDTIRQWTKGSDLLIHLESQRGGVLVMVCHAQQWPLVLTMKVLGDWRLIDTLTVCFDEVAQSPVRVLFFRKLLSGGRFVPWRYKIRSHSDFMVCERDQFWNALLQIAP